MKKLTYFIFVLITPYFINSVPYETAQRFSEGDVVSAEVLNDILDRLELTLKDITREEMIGSWDATSYLCRQAANDPTVDVNTGNSGCLNIRSWGHDGAVSMEGGLYGKREDTWTITAASGSDTLFNIASTNYSLIENSAVSFTTTDLAINSGKTHKCALISGQAMLACALDPVIHADDSPGAGGVEKTFAAYINVQRLSPTRLKLFWGPYQGAGDFNVIIIDKTDIPPTAPTALSASVSGNADAASVSLSWTVNGSVATGAVVKRKLSFDGSWSTLGTPSSGSFSDTNIALNNTYWYRVFATNANGTSVGSNVVKINWYNTPPTINIPTVVSVNENQSTTSYFTNIWSSDADKQSLTFTLGSQSPSNDASNFTLTDSLLFFKATPDYENPADYDGNNIYDLTVSATDGIESVSQDFSVVVLNVID